MAASNLSGASANRAGLEGHAESSPVRSQSSRQREGGKNPSEVQDKVLNEFNMQEQFPVEVAFQVGLT